MFYIICPNLDFRNNFIAKHKPNNTMYVLHYQSLRKSPFYSKEHDGREFINSDYFTGTLVRLHLFFELEIQQIINDFQFQNNLL
jgi:dTDP-4-amino-4,6-dideoxygalactose transaminase